MQLGKRPALKLWPSDKCFGVDTGGQVQAAIDADDEKQLVKLLQDFKGTHASLSFDSALFSMRHCEYCFLCTAAREHSPFKRRRDVPGILPAEKVEKAQRRLW